MALRGGPLDSDGWAFGAQQCCALQGLDTAGYSSSSSFHNGLPASER
jgi:hypothetical protein